MKGRFPCIDCKYLFNEYIFYGIAIMPQRQVGAIVIKKIVYILYGKCFLKRTNGMRYQILWAWHGTEWYN